MYVKPIGFAVLRLTDGAYPRWEEDSFHTTTGTACGRLRDMGSRDSKRLVAVNHVSDTPGMKPNEALVLWEGKRVPPWLGVRQYVGATDFTMSV
ncbi:hypothetical protein SEA_OBLADI_149 [Gordonia phage ObLaDi]|uniref:Uncharacterized protein n=3 Tax=Cafassovirus TaxID=3425056 RepID=A0A9E7TVJ8_9CAUD|nr:hypothetical protein SEA_CAFASSO_150 [Gordonia phage Cafasso]UVK59888.1 hypothetical protein SEA_ALEEMILY_148 [Gordonia phage Aleemily]UXE03872.1 hypothetical protein SEA_OBLADI_149 [Gordonia phage ObLaDi]